MLKKREDLFEKTCIHCGKIFKTDKPHGTVCPDCLRKSKNAGVKSYRREAAEKAKKTESPAITILGMVKKVENYNREHKTNYTYGQFCEKLNRGEITI